MAERPDHPDGLQDFEQRMNGLVAEAGAYRETLVKSLLLINGGAAIATLPLLANILDRTEDPEVLAAFGRSLRHFATGVGYAALTTFFVWWNTIARVSHLGSSRYGKPPRVVLFTANFTMTMSVVAMVSSLYSFIRGALNAQGALLALAIP
jgi:hypothetical protein